MVGFVPEPKFDDYKEVFKEHLAMTRRDGIIEVRMHTRESDVSWSFELYKALGQAFHTIGADSANEVMILTATDDSWVAHFDEESFAAIETDMVRNSYDYGYSIGRQSLLSLINSVEIPTIGAINGHGGHMELALMCDLTICSDNAVISDPHYALNMVPGDGIHSALIELMGVKRATYAMLMHEQIDASTALEYGLVNEVVARDRLLDRAWEMAGTLMAAHRMVRRMTTQIVRRPWRQRISDDLDGAFGMEMYAALCSGSQHENAALDATLDANQ